MCKPSQINVGGAGHWISIDTERMRELLERREYVGVYVSRIGGAVTGGWGGWVGGVGLKGKIETG